MKLFFSDREPRPTPAVCGPPTDLSFYNASLSPTHRDYHRRNVFLRQRRALQLETATEQRTTVLLPLLFLGDRDSDRHRRAGSPFRSRALRIIGCGIADGWRGEKISSTPGRISTTEEGKFASFCPREGIHFKPHLRDIPCRRKEERRGKANAKPK